MGATETIDTDQSAIQSGGGERERTEAANRLCSADESGLCFAQ